MATYKGEGERVSKCWDNDNTISTVERLAEKTENGVKSLETERERVSKQSRVQQLGAPLSVGAPKYLLK